MWVNRPRPVEAAGARAGERRVAGSPLICTANARGRAAERRRISAQLAAAKGRRSLRREIEIKAGSEVGGIRIFLRHLH